MQVLYSVSDYNLKDFGKLYIWDQNILNVTNCKKINIGDPVKIEYRRVSISSEKLDKFGKSEIMVINYLRNIHTKKQSVESITYFDDNAQVHGPVFGRKKWSVGEFDASEYGNPVCFYSPGYQGSVILLTTKLWELDDPGPISELFRIAKYIIGIIPNSPYMQLASSASGAICRILTASIDHDEIAEHTIEFRQDSRLPFVEGKYICLPGIDLNKRNKILNKYRLEENVLVKNKIINGKNTIIEYGGNYFILKVGINKDPLLEDFDFIASSSELLKKLNNEPISVQHDIISINKSDYIINLIQKIQENITSGDYQLANSLYKHLPSNWQYLFENKFEHN